MSDLSAILDHLADAVAARVIERLQQSAAPPVSQPDERMRSEPEAAAVFCVAPHVLRDARKRGELECTRVGKRVRYSRAQLEAWKRKQREQGGSQNDRKNQQPAV